MDEIIVEISSTESFCKNLHNATIDFVMFSSKKFNFVGTYLGKAVYYIDSDEIADWLKTNHVLGYQRMFCKNQSIIHDCFILSPELEQILILRWS